MTGAPTGTPVGVRADPDQGSARPPPRSAKRHLGSSEGCCIPFRTRGCRALAKALERWAAPFARASKAAGPRPERPRRSSVARGMGRASASPGPWLVHAPESPPDRGRRETARARRESTSNGSAPRPFERRTAENEPREGPREEGRSGEGTRRATPRRRRGGEAKETKGGRSNGGRSANQAAILTDFERLFARGFFGTSCPSRWA